MCYLACMRKNKIFTALSFGFVGGLLLATAPAMGFCQAAVTSPVMPSDPKALMLLAAQSNGLTGADIKPWHLKATYKVLDADGKATD